MYLAINSNERVDYMDLENTLFYNWTKYNRTMRETNQGRLSARNAWRTIRTTSTSLPLTLVSNTFSLDDPHLNFRTCIYI